MAQGVNIKIQDNGLGQSPSTGQNTLVVIGVSASGTANLPEQSTDPNTWLTDFGYGPGVEAAAFITQRTGEPVIFVKAATVTSGTNSPVTATRVGTPSTSVMTLTGTPLDTYYGKVTVIDDGNGGNGGTIGTAGMQIGVSLDAGRTTYVTVNLLTATTVAVANTGLTLNFGAGTLKTGDVFTWVSIEPKWSDATVHSAVLGLLATPDAFRDILIVGDAASGDAVAFDGEATLCFNRRRFTRILTNARDAVWGGTSTETEQQWINALELDFQSFQSDRISVSAGAYNAVSPISQTQFRRPLSWFAAQRDSGVDISVDLGRVSDGSLPAILPTKSDGFIYHDETVNPGLDGARFLTVWTLFGFPGVFIKNPNIMAAPGSDFNWLQHGHVIDVASQVAYQFFTKELSDSVRVNKTTGFILEQDAKDLELRCTQALSDALTNQNFVSDASCAVSRSDNILATNQLHVTISVTPLAYLKDIEVTIRFQNPAIQTV